MQIGSWVQWTPPHFHGSDLFAPMRGWVVAVEGDWVVVRSSTMRAPSCPFATFHVRDLQLLEEHQLVQVGALQLT